VVLASALGSAAALATAAGIFVAAIALFLQRRESRTHFEDDLVHEYRETIKPRLITLALIPRDLPDEQFKQAEAFYPYIDLCNEQTFLRMAGRVSRRTWRQWSDGISGNLGRDAFNQAWWTIRESAPDDFKELQLLIDSGYCDPGHWLPWHRRLLQWIGVRDVIVEDSAKRLLARGQIVSMADVWRHRVR
jgi:N-acylglucosamine 2-epimerase (GlcNAc 2-epimerase)